MKKLKTLSDQSKFRIDPTSKVTYTLQSLDHKKRTATYTSDKSGMTFTKGWGKEVWAV